MKLLFLIISLALPCVARATTFGPIALAEQIEHSQYIVEGIIHSSSVQLEPNSKLPHTYYSFTMTEQHKGASLPNQFQIREPGGEIGGKGYQVAGVPTFSEEEEVVLYLKDTNEDFVKEVTGLSSGKFSKKSEGENVFLVNGLGYPVTGSDGKKMKLYEFLELISRVSHDRATLLDRSIMLNEGPESHGYAGSPAAPAQTVGEATQNSANNTDLSSAKNVNFNKSPADKNAIGSSVTHWQIGIRLALLAIVTVALIVYFRRMRE